MLVCDWHSDGQHLQVFAFIEVHATTREFPSRQHVENLPYI